MPRVCHWRCLALCWRHPVQAVFLTCVLIIVCVLFVREASDYSLVRQDEPNLRQRSPPRRSIKGTVNHSTRDSDIVGDGNTDGDGKRKDGNINLDGNTKDDNTQRDGNRKGIRSYTMWNGNYFRDAQKNRNAKFDGNTNRDGNSRLDGIIKYSNTLWDLKANKDGNTQTDDNLQGALDTILKHAKLASSETASGNSAHGTSKAHFSSKRVNATGTGPVASNTLLEGVSHQPKYFPFLRTFEPVIFQPTDSLRAFKSMMTHEEHQIFLDLTDALSGALDKAQIPYFLYGGALIGSWRHHGMVPWDDDIDVAVPYDRQEEILQVLKGLAPDFLIKFRPKYALKFFSSKSKKVPFWSWSWPFIDVWFYLENATHVIEPDRYFPEYKFRKEQVFPLRKRPFEGRMLPVPCQTETYLQKTYDLEKCLVGEYSHRVEKGRAKEEQAGPIDCEPLKKLYPFVERDPVPSGGCNETLVRGSEVLGWYYDPEQTC